jgi:hypothetical protein
MKSRFLAVCFLFLAAMAIPHRAKAPIPFIPRLEVPGEALGKASGRWLAPYVRATEEIFGGHRTETVTWFSKVGSVRTQIAGFAQSGYVIAHEDGQTVAYGINEPWKVALPKKPDDLRIGPFPGADTCTPDSRTFIRPFTPEPGQNSLEVYAHGVLTATLGPFVRHMAQQFEMNDDGSMAAVIWKDATKTTPQVVCADRDGSIRFRVDCDETDSMCMPAPDGAGVILRDMDMPERRKFTCYTREGKGRTVALTPNSRCIGWIPGTLRSLFSTSVGFDSHYHMIDWDSGKELWEIPCPGNLHAAAITITSRLVIFLVAERYKGYHTGGGWGDSQWMLREGEEPLIRAFYAFRVEDGRMVARGQAAFPRFFSEREQARLMQVRNKIYFLTTEEFTEINEEDIIEGKNGWKLVSVDR